jgi:hypothetical protein
MTRSWQKRQGKTGCTRVLPGRLMYHWLARNTPHATPEAQSGPMVSAVFHRRDAAASSNPVMSSVTPANVDVEPMKSKVLKLARGGGVACPW